MITVPMTVIASNVTIPMEINASNVEVPMTAVSNIVTIPMDLSIAYASVDAEPYEGSYRVIPKVTEQTLETSGLLMTNDVTVTEVPYYQTHNTSGETVYIANEV